MKAKTVTKKSYISIFRKLKYTKTREKTSLFSFLLSMPVWQWFRSQQHLNQLLDR